MQRQEGGQGVGMRGRAGVQGQEGGQACRDRREGRGARIGQSRGAGMVGRAGCRDGREGRSSGTRAPKYNRKVIF